MNTFQEVVATVAEAVAKKTTVPVDKQLQQLLQHPRIQAFSKEHPHIAREVYQKCVNRLYQFVREWDNCNQCPGLARCPNLVQGYQPHLVSHAGYVELHLKPCQYKWRADLEAKRLQKVRSHYIPEDILSATFESLELDPERKDAIFAAMTFAAEFEPGKKKKGLYFYGDFGVGKSCIAGAIARELANRDVSVYMVYVPEFFRELKESIQQGTAQEKIDSLKEVAVLILDDIGAEVISPWIRDEILGSILLYRVTKSLPTIYTSNLSYDELEEHFAYSQKSGFEYQKAKRLMERIRHETTAYYVGGPNRREMEEN